MDVLKQSEKSHLDKVYLGVVFLSHLFIRYICNPMSLIVQYPNKRQFIQKRAEPFRLLVTIIHIL